ncbi:helix-turn-helix domain-containing protein [Shinella sp.]|uniref:helix-turn-helix domain-containing protein n=1 Tax=Shinella sp. TaxID=1870904 RepID=UPI0039E303EA
MPRNGKGPRARPHTPVPIQRQRPAKKQGRVTLEDVEAVVGWYLDTHWFDTEAAAAYLRREPGTLKGWRSKGEGPRFHTVNGQFVRYHVDDLDAFVRGGKPKKRIPAWLMDRVAERTADRLLPAVKPPREGDDK